MSIHKSYFDKNNTIIYNSSANTGQNPVTELFFGRVDNTLSPPGFSRFIFNLDLSQLEEKISEGVIYTGNPMTHKLKMTNTIMFNYDLLNGTTSDSRRRASSFDLYLLRIPQVDITGDTQNWDEGVGYDYYDTNNKVTNNASLAYQPNRDNDQSYSSRPSNWFKATTLSGWSTDGIYVNDNSGVGTSINFSALTLVDTQHFEFGNEDINFDMTDEINGIINGTITDITGWGIAYRPEFELITGLTANYSVSFFTRHTQTFYEPYLENSYNDVIEDDRNLFTLGRVNKLYLYLYDNGEPISLDSTPTVSISTAPSGGTDASAVAITTSKGNKIAIKGRGFRINSHVEVVSFVDLEKSPFLKLIGAILSAGIREIPKASAFAKWISVISE